MAYLARARGREGLKLRDFGTGEMRTLSVREWVRFEDLPPWRAPPGDGDIEIKEVVEDPKPKAKSGK